MWKPPLPDYRFRLKSRTRQATSPPFSCPCTGTSSGLGQRATSTSRRVVGRQDRSLKSGPPIDHKVSATEPSCIDSKSPTNIRSVRSLAEHTRVSHFRSLPPLSAHPVDVGQRTETAIAEALVRRGFTVLQPIGSNHRYDLVVEVDGDFLRVQCKTGRLRDGAVTFKTISVRVNTKGARVRHYDGEVDYFAVYCSALDRVYLVPFEVCRRGETFLRVEPCRNHQVKGIRWARDYELPALDDLDSSRPAGVAQLVEQAPCKR
jgi:hypothetical protein